MKPALAIRNRLRGGASIGGVFKGAVGAGIYAGTVMVDGDNAPAMYNGIRSPANLLGAYGTTRAYGVTASGGTQGAERAPGAGQLDTSHDCDPYYTGYADSNRGVPIPYTQNPPHQLVSDATYGQVLRMYAVKNSTSEQILLATGLAAQINRTSMLHTASRKWKCRSIIETMVRMPTAPAGHHPDVWNTQLLADNTSVAKGIDYGCEGNGARNDFGIQAWTGTATNQFTDNSSYTGMPDIRDGNWHLITFIPVSGSGINAYIDGTLVRLAATDPDSQGDKADYQIWTNHILDGTYDSEAYSPGAWTTAYPGGATMDVAFWRVWSSGTDYVPLIGIESANVSGTGATVTATNKINVTYGNAWTITLPSQSALWGHTSLSEKLRLHQTELNAPWGSTATTSYVTLPTGVTFNTGTRVLSGTNTTAIGAGGARFVLYVGDAAHNTTCTPLVFEIYTAPVFVGSTSVPFTNGDSTSSYDLYAAWDVGMLYTGIAGGTSAKTLTATSIPTGMSLGSNGKITGTPTSNAVFTVATSATNSQGQTSTQNVTMTVTAASSPVAKPTVTGTLVGSWGFNGESTITLSGSNVTNLTGADSTSFALANAGSSGCTVTTITDGNGNNKTVGRFTATSSQYLQIANNLGVTGAVDCTVVVVYQPVLTSATAWLLDIGNGGAAAGANRHSVLGSTSVGYGYRKIDGTPTSSVASVGSAYNSGIHLIVGRSTAGTGLPAKLNFDGAGTAITAGTNSNNPSGLSHTTLGAERAGNAQVSFADGYVYRILVYTTALSDADVETIAVWANTNYGTANNA